MRIENTSRIATTELKRELTAVLKRAPLGKARAWLTGKEGLYIVAHNAKYSRVAGMIYPSAICIYRKGKLIPVRGYIKLFIKPEAILKDIAHTFAHELSHYKDWYDHNFGGYGKIPYGQEKRARAFADRVVKR